MWIIVCGVYCVCFGVIVYKRFYIIIYYYICTLHTAINKHMDLIAPRESIDRTDDLVAAFLADQDVNAASRMVYGSNLRQFLAWIQATGREMRQAVRADIVAYKQHLMDKGHSGHTIASYLTSVRRFYEWAEACRYYPNVAKGVRPPKHLPEFRRSDLLPEECEQLILHFAKRISQVDIATLRDHAIVSVLLRTGIRLIEAVRANVADIGQLWGERVLHVQGKGRTDKGEIVKLTDKAFVPLDTYLRARGSISAADPLFVSESNNGKPGSRGKDGRVRDGRLSTRHVSQLVKDGLQAIGLTGREYVAHSLRHTTATSILRAGGDMEDVRMVLRHKSIAPSEGYVRRMKQEQRVKQSPERLLDGLF